jgi:hypothetical protein
VLYRNKSRIPKTPNKEGLISLQGVASWSSTITIRPRNKSSTFSTSIKLPTQNEYNHLLKLKTMSTPLETPSQNPLTLTRPLSSVYYLSIYLRLGNNRQACSHATLYKYSKGPGEAYMKENVQGMDINLKIALGES